MVVSNINKEMNHEEIMMQQSEWTKEHEEILKEWKAKAFAYLWLQNNSCYHYLRTQNWLAYTVIVLSSVSSATIFSVTTSGEAQLVTIGMVPVYIIQYVIGALSLLSAILTGVIRQLKPGEMYQQHASAAKKYHNLIRSIDACLSLTRNLRPNPALFIERAGAELDTLANTQLEPPLFVIRRFETIYGSLERVLYGEDVIELWKITYETNKLEQKMRNRLRKSSRSDEKNETGSFDEQKDIENCKTLSPSPVGEKVRGSVEIQLAPGGKFLLDRFYEPFKTTVKIPSTT